MTLEKEEQLRKEFDDFVAKKGFLFYFSSQDMKDTFNFFLEHLKEEESKPKIECDHDVIDTGTFYQCGKCGAII